MPVFMDRHEVGNATAQDVADAHMSDLNKSVEYGVEFLSYWFDSDSGGVFCLAKAPDADRLMAVHRASHGLVPNEIIGVSEDNVLRFLGQIKDPVDASQVTSPFRIIMFTDLAGSTALLDAVGDATFMTLLGEHDVIIRRAIVAWNGREVKHTGDGFMASFDAVADALECSLAMQAGFVERNQKGRTRQLVIRVGLAAGEPVDHNEDIYGRAVNLASRICDATQPGSTLVSDVVEQLGSRDDFIFSSEGTRTLKGFSVPVPVYSLVGSPRRTRPRWWSRLV
jgi:class 3 adenylate cyclase